MSRPRTWTDAQFLEALTKARSSSELCRMLGLTQGSTRTLKYHADRLGKELPTWKRMSRQARRIRHAVELYDGEIEIVPLPVLAWLCRPDPPGTRTPEGGEGR